MPTCTVAIPVYNRRDLVRSALESALVQDVDGLEVLVVDNCSTDGTWEALETYRDPRLRLVRNESNLGLFGNFNRCLELSTGTYLHFLCSDDRLVKGCLREEIGIMDRHPRVVLLSTVGVFVDERGCRRETFAGQLDPGIYSGRQAIETWFRFFACYGQNVLNYPSGVLFRREAAVKAGRFDSGMYLAGDIDFYMRVLAQGDLAVSRELGCEVMLHPGQEQARALVDGTAMREHFGNLERHRELLLDKRSYHRIRRQLAGVVLGQAITFWRTGQRAPAVIHLEVIRTSGIGRLGSLIAFARYYVYRALFRAWGLRLLRMPAPLPL